MRTFAHKRKSTPVPARAWPKVSDRSGSDLRRKIGTILHGAQDFRQDLRREPADGPPSSLIPVSRVAPRLQRTIRARVVSQLEADPRDAAACMVHVHPNEQNALEVAKDLRATRCANLVFLEDTSGRSTPQREIQVETTGAGGPETCSMDSNRIFSAAGRDPDTGEAFSGCTRDAKAAAGTEVETFVRTDLGPAISSCRGGEGRADMAGPLPVVAFHNNTNTAASTAAALRTASLNIHWYERGGTAASSAERDPARLAGRTNPAIQARQDPDNFLLVTRPEDFDAFRGQRNVVLQAGSPTDDGSLSVVLASQRYINIEAEGKAYRGHGSSRFATNRAMAEEVFQHLGVPERPCIGGRSADIEETGTPAIQESAQRARQAIDVARRWALRWRGTDFEPIAEQEAEYDRRVALERHWREVQAIRGPIDTRLRELRASIAGTPLPCPTPAPARARVFCSSREIDNRKLFWARRIGEMDPDTVIEWIAGQTDCHDFARTLRRLRRGGSALSSAEHDRMVMCEAFEEAQQQIDALRAAMPDAAARGTRDPLRTFGDQQTIWEEKYRFLPSRGTFGSIRQDSQDTCVAALGGGDATRENDLRTRVFPVGGEWDTDVSRHPEHRDCWLNHLTPEQRQREILQTSSAPGISRHHLGTDVDLGSGSASLTNTAWSPGGTFASSYEWLQSNALVYGMIQPFTAGRTAGYLEERWHWSYLPVAQALVDFATAHQAAIETRLGALWDQRVQAMAAAGHIPAAAPGATQEDPYSFVRAHWRDFVFQVLQGARSP